MVPGKVRYFKRCHLYNISLVAILINFLKTRAGIEEKYDLGLSANRHVLRGLELSIPANLICEILLNVNDVDVYWRFNWGLSSGKLVAESIWIRGSSGETLPIIDYQRSRRGDMPWAGLIAEGSIMAVVEARSLSPEHADLLATVHAWGLGVTSLELLSPTAMRGGVRGSPVDIGPRGERLAGFLAGLPAQKKEKLVRRLKDFYPLTELDTTRKRAGWVDLRVAEAYNPARIRAAHMSDGFMRILALCAIPEFEEDVSLVLLDEVEDGIEPHILPRLVDRISKDSSAQILMTSHSPLLVNFFEFDQICFLARTPEVTAHPLVRGA